MLVSYFTSDVLEIGLLLKGVLVVGKIIFFYLTVKLRENVIADFL